MQTCDELRQADSNVSAKLQQGVEKLTDEEKPITAELRTLRTQLLRSMPVLARLVALFCQFGNFDRLRASSPGR